MHPLEHGLRVGENHLSGQVEHGEKPFRDEAEGGVAVGIHLQQIQAGGYGLGRLGR